ncbi:PIN domain-containing protein [Streptomyces niveus]|uniref:PIN domain-containing protein n=1 Tax=Streptomyces niveus TaxID=193462 RepID=UPI002E311974|nr:PIN domain-containing protein [Streptomyces niveus]
MRKHWRKKFGELVEVLPTSEVVMAQALFREANALPPCKQTGSPNNKKKSGARDAAIWLTAVAYAHDHPNETVFFFVSDNTKDFGDGSSHAFPMKEDIAGLGERFVHLTSLGQLLDRFAQPAKVDQAQVSNRLANFLPSDAIWSSFSMIARGSGEDGGTTL